MESNGLSSVMFSGFSPGMLSLETPQNPQNSQNPQNPMQFQHPQMVSYAGNNGGGDHHHHQHQTQPPTTKPSYPYASKPKQLSPLSDEDDPGSGSGSGYNPDDSAGAEGKRKFSPWQRMKWTDTMVRLLIMAVFYIGDEAGSSESAEQGKKKPSGGGGGGLLQQKKGKWKSVSRAMMEKGFYVSPQQCEDKFNDLNKRYKRVNDILGRGTACRVVENQGLLETMDLAPKLKEEVKKLLNSKHLFFREMCAYHNSCGHLTATDQTQPQQQQICFHAAGAGDSGKMGRIAESEEEEGEEEEEEETTEDWETEEEWEGERAGKRRRKTAAAAAAAAGEERRLREEAERVAVDAAKGAREKKEWMRRKTVELQERSVGYEWEAVEIEKQKLKWMRFRSKKEREMEKARLDIQRRRLENERMLLVLRRKEMELEQQSGKRVDPGTIVGQCS